MKKKNKEKAITLSKENLLYQPLSLSVSGYKATAFQQNVVIAVLRRLKNAFREMRDMQFSEQPKALSLFETEEVGLYKSEEDYISFDIHMNELGASPKHYQEVFDAVCKLSDVVIWVPEEKTNGGTEYVRDRLFKISIDEKNMVRDEQGNVIRYQYLNRSPRVKLRLSRKISNVIFNPKSRIYDFLDDTAMMISASYPKRLYMYLSNYKYMEDGIVIGYWKFRKQIGFNDEEKVLFPRFYDFKKNVLESSYKTLKDLAEKNLSDFWFEYEPIYEHGARAKSPDKIHFIIHLSEVGENIKNEKKGTPFSMELDRRLREDFGLTIPQIRKIFSFLNAEDYRFLQKKMDDLENYFNSTKIKVKDKRAYAAKVLTEFAQEVRKKSAETRKTELEESTVTAASPAKEMTEKHHLAETGAEEWENVLQQCKRIFSPQEYAVLASAKYNGLLDYYPYISFGDKETFSLFMNTLYERLVPICNSMFKLDYPIHIIKCDCKS